MTLLAVVFGLIALAIAFHFSSPVGSPKLRSNAKGGKSVTAKDAVVKTAVPGIDLTGLLHEITSVMGKDAVAKAVRMDTKLGKTLMVTRAAKGSYWFLPKSRLQRILSSKVTLPTAKLSRTSEILRRVEAAQPAIKKTGGKVLICRQGVYLKAKNGKLIAVS